MIEGDLVHPSGCHPASDTPALFENADIGDRRQRSRDRDPRHPRADDPDSLSLHHNCSFSNVVD